MVPVACIRVEADFDQRQQKHETAGLRWRSPCWAGEQGAHLALASQLLIRCWAGKQGVHTGLALPLVQHSEPTSVALDRCERDASPEVQPLLHVELMWPAAATIVSGREEQKKQQPLGTNARFPWPLQPL